MRAGASSASSASAAVSASRVVKPLIAILGPTATGKSALGIAIAERFDGEIINCDSTAVYRGFDIGTDKVPIADRGEIPHHLIDIADPTDEYTAAHFARDAAAIVRDLHARGKVPILVGGTGFYYRALTRGLFPGPGKNATLRARLEAIASKHGVEALHRVVARVDPDSALRIQPRDRKRLVRALEVYFETGRPLTAHFADTTSPLEPDVCIGAVALRMPAAVARRPPGAGGSTPNSTLACSTKFVHCSPPACRLMPAPSAALCIDRPWSTFAACATSAPRAR